MNQKFKVEDDGDGDWKGFHFLCIPLNVYGGIVHIASKKNLMDLLSIILY